MRPTPVECQTICRVVSTDTRAVRPYIPCSNQFVCPSTRQLSTKLIINGLHLAFQSHPFCTVTSLISHGGMTHVAVQYGPYCKPGHSLPVLQETQPAPPKTYPESLPIPTPTLLKGGSPSLRAWRMLHSVCPRREYSEGCRACKPLLHL